MTIAEVEAKLLEWTAAANALELISAVRRQGVLASLRSGATPEEIALQTNVDVEQARRICLALQALEIVESDGSTFRLAGGWRDVDSPDRPLALGDRLDYVSVLKVGVASAFDSAPGFEEVPVHESVALARSIWGAPQSPVALESWAGLDAAMPEVRAVWQAGARHAEFGCGAGRDLIRVVAMYRNVTAVGYELIPEVMRHAQELATALGVASRVALRCQDVRDAQADSEFDTLLWSQMFFPPESRHATLETIKRALRPGGYLIMPLLADMPDEKNIDTSVLTRMRMLVSVAYNRWGLYWPKGESVRREVEESGFVHVRSLPHPRTPFLVMQLPAK